LSTISAPIILWWLVVVGVEVDQQVEAVQVDTESFPHNLCPLESLTR
jgi:hypothetical protein